MSAPAHVRLAVRGIVLIDGRLLLVNAYAGSRSRLWCAPGGGVRPHASLPQNLAREVWEETGLRVDVLEPVLVNEFHAPGAEFHQVDIFFRTSVRSGTLHRGWRDPEGVVERYKLVNRQELADLHHRPRMLSDIAWSEDTPARYDPLEILTQ